jgi:hypothetical protein
MFLNLGTNVGFPSRLARSARQRQDRPRLAERHAMPCAVLGYPAGWPAGPWTVPLFWIAVLLGALALRSVGQA